MSKNYYIIPIFISHQGCPHQCVFCNQDRIAGKYEEVFAEDVRNTIEEYLSTINKGATVEVSFFGGTFTAISVAKQKELLEAMNYAQSTPSVSQAQRIKKLSKTGELTKKHMEDILSEIKKGEVTRVEFNNAQLHKFFPYNYSPAMMKREILAILKIYKEQYSEK